MKTLLNGVNEVLKRVQIVSESNLLTTLTHSGKQVFIDLSVQAWNEAVDQLYSKANIMTPQQAAEGRITLVANKRKYSLEDDLIQLIWPLQDETNGQYIEEYQGGYEELRHSQSIPANYPGLPSYGAISPIDGELYLDRVPTVDEAGLVYKYLYWRDTVLENASDVFPFGDGVFRALVPVVAEIWRLMQQNKYSKEMAKMSYGRALRMVREQIADSTWITRPVKSSTSPLGFDPFTE